MCHHHQRAPGKSIFSNANEHIFQYQLVDRNFMQSNNLPLKSNNQLLSPVRRRNLINGKQSGTIQNRKVLDATPSLDSSTAKKKIIMEFQGNLWHCFANEIMQIYQASNYCKQFPLEMLLSGSRIEWSCFCFKASHRRFHFPPRHPCVITPVLRLSCDLWGAIKESRLTENVTKGDEPTRRTNGNHWSIGRSIFSWVRLTIMFA